MVKLYTIILYIVVFVITAYIGTFTNLLFKGVFHGYEWYAVVSIVAFVIAGYECIRRLFP